MKKLVHNCPNCGAPLDANGYCAYCKTKIRYANELEFQTFNCNAYPGLTEMLLKIKNGDETILYPFKGYLENISLNSLSYDSYPEISVSFRGFIDRDWRTER